MKLNKLLLSAALIMSCAGAYAADPAATNTQTGVNSNSQTNSSSGSIATNGQNAQSITFTSPEQQTTNVHYSGDQTIRNVPSVSGPPLTTSNDTCMGSSSGSANAPGIGVSFGTTWSDTNCKMLKNSRELWNMGMKAAAMALMCNDPDNRKALELTNYSCPQAAAEQKSSTPATAANGADMNDPFIRARNGK